MKLAHAMRYLDARVQRRCDGNRAGWTMYDVEAVRAVLAELRRAKPLIRVVERQDGSLGASREETGQ